MASDAVRQRLDELIREHREDYASVSRLLSRNAAYIQQFIKRGVPKKLSEIDRRSLARHFGVAERELGGPDDEIGRAIRPRGSDAEDGDYMLIPCYDLGASAGPGTIAEEETAESALAFQSSWIRSVARGGSEALSVIRVRGDSMYPTLSDGDHILVDSGDREQIRDGVYVIRTDDALHVKRVSIDPRGRSVSVRSDNPSYPSWENCDPAALTFVGRVVWVGRRL